MRTPSTLPSGELSLILPPEMPGAAVFFNGIAVGPPANKGGLLQLPKELWETEQLNLITLRCKTPSGGASQFQLLASQPPMLKLEDRSALLDGPWQCVNTATESSDQLAAFPIPPQFGAPTDLIHNWPFE